MTQTSTRSNKQVLEIVATPLLSYSQEFAALLAIMLEGAIITPEDEGGSPLRFSTAGYSAGAQLPAFEAALTSYEEALRLGGVSREECRVYPAVTLTSLDGEPFHRFTTFLPDLSPALPSGVVLLKAYSEGKMAISALAQAGQLSKFFDFLYPVDLPRSLLEECRSRGFIPVQFQPWAIYLAFAASPAYLALESGKAEALTRIFSPFVPEELERAQLKEIPSELLPLAQPDVQMALKLLLGHCGCGNPACTENRLVEFSVTRMLETLSFFRDTADGLYNKARSPHTTMRWLTRELADRDDFAPELILALGALGCPTFPEITGSKAVVLPHDLVKAAIAGDEDAKKTALGMIASFEETAAELSAMGHEERVEAIGKAMDDADESVGQMTAANKAAALFAELIASKASVKH